MTRQLKPFFLQSVVIVCNGNNDYNLILLMLHNDYVRNCLHFIVSPTISRCALKVNIARRFFIPE